MLTLDSRTAVRSDTDPGGRDDARRTSGRPNLRRSLTPFAFIGASAFFLAFVLGYPFVVGLSISMTNATLVDRGAPDWVGFENYWELLSGTRLWETLGTTLLYAVGSVGGTLVFALFAALLLNKLFQGRGFGGILRSLVVVPWATPMVAAAITIAWIFNIQYGFANHVVGEMGGEPARWFSDPELAMPLVIVSTIWKIAPMATLVLLAALQSVPEEQKEAAVVDGADAGYVLKTVTIPHIRPTLAVLTVLMTVWAFRRFETIWLLTGGGPLQRTNTLVIDVYREAFEHQNLGLASALGAVGLVLSFIATGIYFLVTQRLERRNA